MKKTLMSLSLILIIVLALTGCYEWPDPIWDPGDDGLATPTITGVDATTLLGGIENITITGTGFGTVAEEVLVYFKKGTTVGRGRTLDATDTQLIVEAPATYSDSLEIWIDRRGCFEYAKYTTELITINAGLKSIPIITSSPLNQVSINENADMTVALGSNKSVYSVTADDSLSLVPNVAFSNSLSILAMRTKGSMIYYTIREMAVDFDGEIRRHKVNDTKNNLNDFEFADNGKVYYVASGFIYSTDYDMGDTLDAKTLIGTDVIADAPYDYTKCTVYDDKLYVAAIYTGDDAARTNEVSIRSFDINTDGTLTNDTEVINWTDDFAGSEISGIKFDTNGKMYVSTLTRTPIYIIDPAGASYADGEISLLYPVLLDDEIISMNWMGNYMAFIGSDADGIRTVYRLNMLEAASANYMP